MAQIGKHEFAEFMVNNRQSFYRIAYSYVKNEQDALDILSEATYKGLLNIKKLREPSFFKTWMTRIIINTALESMRKNSRKLSFDSDMYTNESLEIKDLEIEFDLYTALDTLGEEDKSFIILKYFEQYSFKDIADLFQIPESTVKSKVYRSLAIMRNYMEGGIKIC